MFPGDDRKKWPDDLLTDPRVKHYWDEGKTVGALFSEWFTRGRATSSGTRSLSLGLMPSGEIVAQELWEVGAGRWLEARKQLRSDVLELIEESK